MYSFVLMILIAGAQAPVEAKSYGTMEECRDAAFEVTHSKWGVEMVAGCIATFREKEGSPRRPAEDVWDTT